MHADHDKSFVLILSPDLGERTSLPMPRQLPLTTICETVQYGEYAPLVPRAIVGFKAIGHQAVPRYTEIDVAR